MSVMSRQLLTASLVLFTSAAAPALASPQEDLAFAVGENNHDKHSEWVVNKLVTLKLGPKCWEKVLDKKNRAIPLLAAYSRSIARYAKIVTENDWPGIEGQSAGSRESNRALVEKMVEDFKPKFHLTVTVEGDDCEASGNALWLKYISATTSALTHYPPKAGKATITLNVQAQAKGVQTTVSPDGATFTIVGARAIEKSAWPADIELPMKRVSTKN